MYIVLTSLQNIFLKNVIPRHYFRIFKVSNSGELVIDDLEHLNNTEAHIVAIARDSGSPPRETSVPVLVRFNDQLKKLQSRAQDHDKFTLTVVLGLLLTVFLVICLGLVIYICKDKKNRKSSPSPTLTSHQENGLWTSSTDRRSENDLYMMASSTKSSSVTSLPQLGSTSVALNPLNPHSHQKYASSMNIGSIEHHRGSGKC